MPFVNVKLAVDDKPPSAQQKADVIKGVTQVLVDVLGKNPQTTFVVIEELSTDNFGIGGESVTTRRAKSK